MKRLRRLPTLAFVATLTLTSAVAAINGTPGPVPVIESPPTYGSCNTPISVMSGLSVDANGADMTLSNTSGIRSQDALVLQLLVNGQPRLFWVPVALRSGISVSVHVSFLTPVDSPVIQLCKNLPGGLVDDPAGPVVAVDEQAPAGP